MTVEGTKMAAAMFEEFIDDVSVLPPEIQRRMELIKELDKKSFGNIEELKDKHSKFLQDVQERIKDRGQSRKAKLMLEDPKSVNPELWQNIKEQRKWMEQSSQEKVDVANQCLALVDGYMKKLESQLESLKEQLQDSGQWQETIEGFNDEDDASFLNEGRQSVNDLLPSLADMGSKQPKLRQSSHTGAVPGAIYDPSGQAGIAQADAKIYCHCQRSYGGGTMVACDNKNCKYEWFHLPCVGLDKEPASDKWFCEECVRELKKTGDPRLKQMKDGFSRFVRLSDSEFQRWVEMNESAVALPRA